MILVTGGTGLTGQFVARELLRREESVRLLCRTAPPCAAGVEVAIGDLRDLESLKAAARGASGIVHAACTFTDSEVDIAAMQALTGAWQTGRFMPWPAFTTRTRTASSTRGFRHPVGGDGRLEPCKGFMGPPSFHDARLAFSGSATELRLKMSY